MNGTYFLSRVVKLGYLDKDKLINSLLNPVEIKVGKYTWTFTDLLNQLDNPKNPFIFGKMTRFLSDGFVLKVNTEKHITEEIKEKDLLTTVSPFVYLPNYSGLAYLRVWNQIDDSTFRRRFENLISENFQNLFHFCEIDPITDYQGFSNKLNELEVITELSAKVHPPNPLYGNLWAPLKKYLTKRKISEINVKELKGNNLGINSELQKHIKNIISDSKYDPDEQLDLTDAAILMAADGYGKGKVTGLKNGKIININTSDVHKCFQFEKNPDPFLLAQETMELFELINTERNMNH